MARIKAEEYKKWERNKGKPKMKTALLKIVKKKDTQDVSERKYAKDKKGNIRVNENEIMGRWKEYFMILLNEHNEYKINETAKFEIEAALKGMS